MQKFEIVIPTLFGLEAVCAREVRSLGYETKAVDNGRITLEGDFSAVARLNINLRTAERVLIKIGAFGAASFDELFEKSRALPWDGWIPKDCAFPVKGHALKSKLHSVPDIQSILKKSIVEKLKQARGGAWLSETGVKYQIQFSLLNDFCTLMLDTSGAPLYKRGYRKEANLAPVRETIASAMVQLSFWKPGRLLADPFCGSGTIAIEAAMLGKKIAPGLSRQFAAAKFLQVPASVWKNARDEARAQIDEDADLAIFASDIDPAAIALTAQNCENAGVDDVVRIQQKPVADFSSGEPGGIIICNPPYGERMLEKEQAEEIYRQMGRVDKTLSGWSWYVLTANENFEACFGKKADKKRKIYNGMLKCDLYQYFGPRPQKAVK